MKIAALLCLLALTGCSTVDKEVVKLKATLDTLDTLGFTEIDAPGRYTSTTYRRTEKDDKYISTLIHNNPGLSMPIRIVRERAKGEDAP